MEPYEGPLLAARDFLKSANARLPAVPPRVTLASAHYAIHSFVEALWKFQGGRGKIPRHEMVAQRAEELGLPEGLVDAIGTVEGKIGAIYGRDVGAEEARHALETANRLAEFVAKKGLGRP